MKKTNVRWAVFLIPWLLVITTILLNLFDGEAFNQLIMTATSFILDGFNWFFALMAFICVVLVAAAYISPFGKVRIGGRTAKPLLNPTNYIWIVLCTIMASGILLWACAEPMYHYYNPPSGIPPQSPEAITFLMKNIFLEWTFTPMCIYGMPAILFAFLFYNTHRKYSIGSMLYPIFNSKFAEKIGPLVDCICLFALVCGMAASLGSAVFLIADGSRNLSGGKILSSPLTWTIIAFIIVTAFITSAISGVINGIRILSTINSRIYMLLGLFVLIFGPTAYILKLSIEGFGAYLSSFCEISLFISTASNDQWATGWPVFYWCNWMAWMPITSIFLGKISKGYTVKEIIRAVVIFPALFSVIWLGLFSASSLYYELAGKGINKAMTSGGTAAATYAVLDQLPLSTLSITVFFFIVFISFITASDSNTTAMAGLCTNSVSENNEESPAWLKFVWGITVGGLCVIFINAFKSTDALKYLSNLGGFPVVFLLGFIAVSFVKVMCNPKRYDTRAEDYDEYGKPLPSIRLTSEYEDKKKTRKHKVT